MNSVTCHSVDIHLPYLRLSGLTNHGGNKPPLLALHGWLDNAGSFEELIPYWHDFNVLAIDLPGHGLSDQRSLDSHYHFIDWVYDIYQLVEHLGWQELYIVGHSMGAMIGSVFAAVCPELVKKLFMIDAIGLITTEADQTTAQLRQSLISRTRIAERNHKSVYPSRTAALDARVQVGGIGLSAATLLAKRGVKQVEDGYIWVSDPRLRATSALRLVPQQAEDYIRNIQCPVMMVAGEESSGLIQSMKAHFEPMFAQIECRQMPGGHHCHMTDPYIAATMATTFFGKC